MKLRQLEKHKKIWKDKNINPEAKVIYEYLKAKGYDKLLIHLNVGEIQNIIHIKNVALKKHLKLLELHQYLIYNEYDIGMYEIHLK